MIGSRMKDGEELRLLILEHDPHDAELEMLMLQHAGYDVRSDVATDEREFRAHLRSPTYDVILADYRLPTWTGMDALAVVKEQELDIPFILVTGTLGDERAVECVKEGVADYVVKNSLGRLPLAVGRAIQEKRARIERERTANQIRKLSLAIDQSPASVLITDTNGVIEYVNRTFERVTGHKAHDAVGRTPSILKSGQNPPEVYAELWKTIRAGRVWRGELVNRRRTGEMYWDSVSISPMYDSSGVMTNFLAIQEDVTERRQTEAALREREERFRQLAENMEEVFFILDAQFRETLYISPAYEQIWGRSCQSLYANPRSFLESVVAEDQERLLESVATIQRGVDPGKTEFRIAQPGGQTRWVLAHAVPIRNHRGEVYRISGVALDITERRVLEEQFRQAQKMEAVGRLAGGVAHDFNNLLTIIMSYTSMMLEDIGERDPRRADLEQVSKAASDAASLTRQLLAFSRQQVILPRLVVVEDVVRGMEKMLRRLLTENVELVTVLSAEPSTILIDPGQLDQVIMNLVVNATDAMPHGGRLTIETSAVDLDEAYAASHWPAIPGRFAMLAVTDTGLGMDEATRARIFEPFFTTKELGKGTGLGLATVYGIVKQSGGFIWVYSEPGQGATFKIYFPLAESNASSAEPIATPVAVPRGSETILLVEDAAAVRHAARSVLERYGYRVIEAANGSAALSAIAQHDTAIQLLLTDLVMPGMSGRQLAEQLAPRYPELRVLYMSGYTDDSVIRNGLLTADIPYLQKPFAPEVLVRKVREVLDTSRRGSRS